MARILPQEAKKRAEYSGIPFSSASKKASSEEKGKTVAPRNAEKKSASSAIEYSL